MHLPSMHRPTRRPRRSYGSILWSIGRRRKHLCRRTEHRCSIANPISGSAGYVYCLRRERALEHEMDAQKVLACDLYGTLLDTSSVAAAVKSHFSESEQDTATSVVLNWRKHQLEYTWRLNSMGKYLDFSAVTRRALENALHDAQKSLTPGAIDELMECYDSLTPFPDVKPLLQSISQAEVRALVFSNGTPGMLETSIRTSPGLKDSVIAHSIMPFVSVHDVQRYKPDPTTYRYLLQRLGKKEGEEKDVYLVSGNPFDIVGAATCGLRTIWVDRAGVGWGDGLGRPNNVVRGLEEVPGVLGV